MRLSPTLLVGQLKGIQPAKKGGCWFVGSNNLTAALHVLELWLSPPPLSSLLQFNLGWRHSGSGLLRLFWKMAIKTSVVVAGANLRDGFTGVSVSSSSVRQPSRSSASDDWWVTGRSLRSVDDAWDSRSPPHSEPFNTLFSSTAKQCKEIHCNITKN